MQHTEPSAGPPAMPLPAARLTQAQAGSEARSQGAAMEAAHTHIRQNAISAHKHRAALGAAAVAAKSQEKPCQLRICQLF